MKKTPFAHKKPTACPSSRRKTVRVIAFLMSFAAVTCAALLLLQKERIHTVKQKQQIRASVLFHMAENAYSVKESLSLASAAEADFRAIAEHCAAIHTCAALLPRDDPAASAVDDAAVFYHALSTVPLEEMEDETTKTVYSVCADRCAALLAELALTAAQEIPVPGHSAFSSSAVQTTTEALSALSRSFAPDTARLLAKTLLEEETDSHTGSRGADLYRGEPIISSAEAEAILNDLPDSGGMFFRLDKTPALSNGTPELYRFTCKSGYAELTAHGGHLIRYALMPTAPHSDAECVTRALSDNDLCSMAFAFLSKVGVPVTLDDLSQDETVYEDRHGVRYYTLKRSLSDNFISIGVRMCDGRVLWFAEG